CASERRGERTGELVSSGGTQILMQGGMNDRLPIEWYEDLLRFIKTTFPTIHIHAFSPPEFIEFERFFSDGREGSHPAPEGGRLGHNPGGWRGDFRAACAAQDRDWK